MLLGVVQCVQCEDGGGSQRMGRGRHGHVGGRRVSTWLWRNNRGREVGVKGPGPSYEIQLVNDPLSAFTANYRSTVDPFQRDRKEIDDMRLEVQSCRFTRV